MKIESALIQSFITFLINASDEISLTYKIQSLASQLWYMTQVRRGVEVTLFLGVGMRGFDHALIAFWESSRFTNNLRAGLFKN